MDKKINKWGIGTPEVGEFYNFNDPVEAKSVRLPRGKNPEDHLPLKKEELEIRSFKRGQLISNNGTSLFVGHKIPAPGCKKCKAKYLFYL